MEQSVCMAGFATMTWTYWLLWQSSGHYSESSVCWKGPLEITWSNPLLKGQLNEVAQGPVYSRSEYLLGWTFRNLTGYIFQCWTGTFFFFLYLLLRISLITALVMCLSSYHLCTSNSSALTSLHPAIRRLKTAMRSSQPFSFFLRLATHRFLSLSSCIMYSSP